MMHMKLNSQKILSWIIRLSGIYLFIWWALLYLSFSTNIEVFPLSSLDYVKAVFLGSLGSISLFSSTIKYQGWLKHIIVGLLIVFGCIYYVYFSIGKMLLIYAFGIITHILAMVIFIKLNIKGETK